MLGNNILSIPPIRAKKSLGQNFLIDEDALSDIAESIEVSGKHIIEVGPGYGALTEHLIVKNPASLDLVELDDDMIALLGSKLEIRNSKLVGKTEDSQEWIMPSSHDLRVTIYEQDVLKFTPPYEQYSVIANIPYYITSPILFHFLYPIGNKKSNMGFRESSPLSKGDVTEGQGDLVSGKIPPTPFDKGEQKTDTLVMGNTENGVWNSPKEMVIMMQKEVGEKILAGRARKPHHSLLSLAMEQACEDIEAVRYVGKESFRPAPKVDSIVLKFIVKKERNREEENALIKLWERAFTHPRKTLISNLKGYYDTEIIKKWINECGYDEKVRAEAVRREDWKDLM